MNIFKNKEIRILGYYSGYKDHGNGDDGSDWVMAVV
jgi:hypothetical protein